MKTCKIGALPLYQFALIVTAEKEKAEELTKKALKNDDSLQAMWQELSLCDSPMGERYLSHAVESGISNRIANTFLNLSWHERGLLFLKLFLNVEQDRISEVTGFSEKNIASTLVKIASEISHQQVKIA